MFAIFCSNLLKCKQRSCLVCALYFIYVSLSLLCILDKLILAAASLFLHQYSSYFPWWHCNKIAAKDALYHTFLSCLEIILTNIRMVLGDLRETSLWSKKRREALAYQVYNLMFLYYIVEISEQFGAQITTKLCQEFPPKTRFIGCVFSAPVVEIIQDFALRKFPSTARRAVLGGPGFGGHRRGGN